MRDLLFKNLTSQDRKKRIITCSEIVDKQCIRSIIHRHFVCMVKEVDINQTEKPLPYLYVLKERDTHNQIEKFFCRIKGSVYFLYNDKLYLILYAHSLKIGLRALPQGIEA